LQKAVDEVGNSAAAVRKELGIEGRRSDLRMSEGTRPRPARRK